MRKYLRFETENLVHFIRLENCPDFIRNETGEEIEDSDEILEWFSLLYEKAEFIYLEIAPPSVAKKEKDGFLSPIF